MNYKKILTMAGLSLAATTGSIKAAPGQDQSSPTSTPARVEHSVKKSKEQIPGLIFYPNFFPLDERGEFDKEKSLEMMKKIPLQELKDAFQKYNESDPRTAENLLDLMSMGNPETKALLKQLQKDEYMRFEVLKLKKFITPEESEKLMKKKEKAMKLGGISLPFITGGLSAMILMAVVGLKLLDNKNKDKLQMSTLIAASVAGIISASAMVTSLSSFIYGYCVGENAQMTVTEAQKTLVKIHQQFFDAYRGNQIEKQLTEKGVPVVAGKGNNEDNTLVTMTMGELRTLIDKSYSDRFNIHAKEKLDSLIKR